MNLQAPAPIPLIGEKLTEEDHRKVFTPGYIQRREKQLVDPVIAAQAQRLAALREDDKPLSMVELEGARNRALRGMVRRMHEMKPAELMEAVEVLEAEIASSKLTGKGEEPEKKQATRQEMIEKLQPIKVQK